MFIGKLGEWLLIQLCVCCNCKWQNLLSNEKAAADVTEAVNCHVGDWSKAAMTSLQRRRIDKIAVVSLDVILLDHAHFSSPVAQVSTAFPFLMLFIFHFLFCTLSLNFVPYLELLFLTHHILIICQYDHCPLGDFTFWISVSLSPETNLTLDIWSQSEVWINWVKTGAKITEYTHIVDVCLTRKIFALYLLFCASLSIALKRVLRKMWCNKNLDKKKVKVISFNKR